MAQAVVDKFIDIANAAREYANEQDDNCQNFKPIYH